MARPRLFNQHQKRFVRTLDGEWDFYFPKSGSRIDISDYQNGERVTIEVPCVWESHAKYVNYRGQAIARRTFCVDRPGLARLVFKGISHTATIYVDGKQVGFHHNAYTPFEIDLPNLEVGEHELIAHITNEHGEVSALHIPNDYYNYGGITRPAELQLLDSRVYIRWVHFTPSIASDGSWKANLRAKVVNLENETHSLELTMRLAGELGTAVVDAKPDENFMELEMRFDEGAVEVWGPENPELYRLEASLNVDGTAIDDWSDRVGFRTVEVKGESILLNSEPIFLYGFNRHEDHAEYGCALPLKQIEADLDLIQDLGANAIRASHYPNDERFLDLCDERGILVWEENHARGLHDDASCGGQKAPPMKHPKFREQCRLVNEEMVTEHYNHPSIVIWGALNECDSYSEYGASCYKEQLEQIRSLDTSRPHTYASCFPDTDICQEYPDICSWNTYFNWYSNRSIPEALEGFFEKLKSRIEGKPFIMSEFGGGAIYGFRDPIRRGRWSEEYQEICLKDCLDSYLSHSRISGAFIWQFCDVRVDDEWAMSRPRTMNNKGVVDEFRRPKLAYELVKRKFLAMKESSGRA